MFRNRMRRAAHAVTSFALLSSLALLALPAGAQDKVLPYTATTNLATVEGSVQQLGDGIDALGNGLGANISSTPPIIRFTFSNGPKNIYAFEMTHGFNSDGVGDKKYRLEFFGANEGQIGGAAFVASSEPRDTVKLDRVCVAFVDMTIVARGTSGIHDFEAREATFIGSDCEPPGDPCCPPVTPSLLKQSLPVSNSGWGPYAIAFTPTERFETGVQRYIDYVVTQKRHAQKLVISWRLDACGPETIVVNGRSAPGGACGSFLVSPLADSWYCGTPPVPLGARCDKTVINPFPSEEIMQAGLWYRATAFLSLPGDGRYWPEQCDKVEIYFLRQATTVVSTAGSPKMIVAYRDAAGLWRNDEASSVSEMIDSHNSLSRPVGGNNRVSGADERAEPVRYKPGEAAPSDDDASRLNGRELERLSSPDAR